MAVYKVPQDVEADDKLLGPFTFRQFIYLILTAFLIGAAFLLAQIFIGLLLIPLPFIFVFGALALPIKKDQPMETYFAAIISFYLKSNKRLWRADGVESVIEITAPKVVEVHRTKDLSETEAVRRLSYLANVMDSEGWSVKGVDNRTSLREDVYAESLEVKDVLDDDAPVASNISNMIAKSNEQRRNEIVSDMKKIENGEEASTSEVEPGEATEVAEQSSVATEGAPEKLSLENVPERHTAKVKEEDTSMRGVYYHPDQAIAEELHLPTSLEPVKAATPFSTPSSMTATAVAKPVGGESTSVKTPPADIIDSVKLANLSKDDNLSVATIAKLANEEQKKNDGEVMIKLR